MNWNPKSCNKSRRKAWCLFEK